MQTSVDRVLSIALIGGRTRLFPVSLRKIRIHDLRHAFASLLLQHGESIVYVKEQLGHASIQITVNTYGHLIPGGESRRRRQAGRCAGATECTPPRNRGRLQSISANAVSCLE